MTLIGNRPEWVMTMCACMRIGAVALPCTEQLRAKDLRLRIAVARPSLIVADERNRAELESALAHGAGASGSGTGSHVPVDSDARGGHADSEIEVVLVPDETLFAGEPAPAVELDESEPCLITFTSGTAGEPKAVLHAQRYLPGQHVQAAHWLGARTGELVWCTAASGWSKSARNVFISPWLRGASALLHDARFDPTERLELCERERVNVLCMAPTEYRVIAARATLQALPALRTMVAAGEALNPEVQRAWREVTGLRDPRRIRSDRDRAADGHGDRGGGPPGLDGQAAAGRGAEHRRWRADRRPAHGADVLPRLPRRGRPARGGRIVASVGPSPGRTVAHGRSCAQGRGRLSVVRRPRRRRDRLRRLSHRPVRGRVRAVAHPAVAEAAAVAAPDPERGAVVRAVVVLRDGHDPSPALARELQEHVKRETAPYKYPRIVEFADELPKTARGKVKRADLRRNA